MAKQRNAYVAVTPHGEPIVFKNVAWWGYEDGTSRLKIQFNSYPVNFGKEYDTVIFPEGSYKYVSVLWEDK